MSPSNRLRSTLLNILLSQRVRAMKRRVAELRRKLTGRPHVVTAFLELDDPYSYLLSLYLPQLQAHYDIELRICLTPSMGDSYKPRPEMLAEYAVTDCERVARELGVPFLDKGSTPPVEHRRSLLDALASNAGSPGFGAELFEALAAYWRGDVDAVRRRAESAAEPGSASATLDSNQRLLLRLGHYNAATLYYGGEWYWGIDRLHYLTSRLDELGANREGKSNPQLASIGQAMQVSLPVRPPAATKDLPPLEIFHSLRSPYSYLSLRRAFEVADAFGLKLVIRPILPMVMRGMKVPRKKLIYIANDTKRESERLGIPFGHIADPVGSGVERCLAVFNYACGEKKERDFLINVGEAIWAEAIDVATDKGMREVAARTGLFWPDVVSAMQDDGWRDGIEKNRESMMESGSWGVPTLRMGNFVVWGQDRIWLLVRHVEELCETGDGILI